MRVFLKPRQIGFWDKNPCIPYFDVIGLLKIIQTGKRELSRCSYCYVVRDKPISVSRFDTFLLAREIQVANSLVGICCVGLATVKRVFFFGGGGWGEINLPIDN
jgi:hypothetical protein